VAATAVLQHWSDQDFESSIEKRSQIVQETLRDVVNKYWSSDFEIRGRGLIWGLDVKQGTLARNIIDESFANGLLIEASGNEDQVLKVMPALTIPMDLLWNGLGILFDAVDTVLSSQDCSGNANDSSVKTISKSVASQPAIASVLSACGSSSDAIPLNVLH